MMHSFILDGVADNNTTNGNLWLTLVIKQYEGLSEKRYCIVRKIHYLQLHSGWSCAYQLTSFGCSGSLHKVMTAYFEMFAISNWIMPNLFLIPTLSTTFWIWLKLSFQSGNHLGWLMKTRVYSFFICYLGKLNCFFFHYIVYILPSLIHSNTALSTIQDWYEAGHVNLKTAWNPDG